VSDTPRCDHLRRPTCWMCRSATCCLHAARACRARLALPHRLCAGERDAIEQPRGTRTHASITHTQHTQHRRRRESFSRAAPAPLPRTRAARRPARPGEAKRPRSYRPAKRARGGGAPNRALPAALQTSPHEGKQTKRETRANGQKVCLRLRVTAAWRVMRVARASGPGRGYSAFGRGDRAAASAGRSPASLPFPFCLTYLPLTHHHARQAQHVSCCIRRCLRYAGAVQS
jgi:hypothetical protein